MLCGSGQYSDLSVSVGLIILCLGTLYTSKRQVTETLLTSVETFLIRKNLNL